MFPELEGVHWITRSGDCADAPHVPACWLAPLVVPLSVPPAAGRSSGLPQVPLPSVVVVVLVVVVVVVTTVVVVAVVVVTVVVVVVVVGGPVVVVTVVVVTVVVVVVTTVVVVVGGPVVVVVEPAGAVTVSVKLPAAPPKPSTTM